MNFIRRILRTRPKKDEAFYRELKIILGFTPNNILIYCTIYFLNQHFLKFP